MGLAEIVPEGGRFLSKQYERLKTLLMELFQLDQPDLDFGFYKIMHARAKEVSKFLDEDLLPQVRAAFDLYRPADRAAIETELSRALEQATELGADPETLPKVVELRERLASEGVDIAGLEQDVYDHLFRFFRRYYSEGDFLAKRVYKDDVYAIPYEGEEVALYWANRDQYYIKSSEYLRDYAFRLAPEDDQDPKRVHFQLADADEGEHGNIAIADDKERSFVLLGADYAEVVDGELVLRFEYRRPTVSDWPDELREGKIKPPQQKELSAFAVQTLLGDKEALGEWIDALGEPHVLSTGESASYSVLESHLRRFTARNTFDYFIHKDLGQFLRQELDFYIKNEVMRLDDIESASVVKVEQYLSKIKVIRRIADKIIAFLSQLEGFQRKLWLKKKFVVSTDYLVALRCIPDELLPDVALNASQIAEWADLHRIDGIEGDLTNPGFSEPLTVEFLKAQPTLMVDTRHFEATFVDQLLESFDDLDDVTDGLVVHGENFQALRLLERTFGQRVQCIYIDPPYNTDAGPIDYKNGYRSSSWMSLIENRLSLARQFLSSMGVVCITIDDYQVHELAVLLDEVLGRENRLGVAVIRNNPSGRSTVKGFSVSHEYAFFYQASDDAALARLPRTEKQLQRFTVEEGVHVDWRKFQKDGGAVTYRTERPKQFYPIFASPSAKTLRIPKLSWDSAQRQWDCLEEPIGDEVVLWPIDEKGRERVWSLNHESAIRNMKDLEVRVTEDDEPQLFRRHFPSDGVLPRSWWDKKTYAAREHGSAALTKMFGDKSVFSFAKSPFAVQDCIWVAGLDEESDEFVMDYFAGSGTTGHATINLNRQDGGRRKFVLVEMGHYVDTVLVPRLKKLTYTPDWKDGRPARFATPEESDRSPGVIKVIQLESYEDSLNNLELKRSTQQEELLGASGAQGSEGFKEQYTLRYMLDVETRGSKSLLDVKGFSDPEKYLLRIRKPGTDESRLASVDLVETFNWLIGLRVAKVHATERIGATFDRHAEGRLQATVSLDAEGAWSFTRAAGVTPNGDRALVVWRRLTDDPEKDNAVLNEWLRSQENWTDIADVVYVNGDHQLELIGDQGSPWKTRLIDDDFQRLMFEESTL